MVLTTQTNGNRGQVLVLGAGVIGLTTALRLSRAGFAVHVVAEHFAPRVTSVVAGALWEWPPAICGHHHDLVSLERSKRWCIESYRIFEEQSRDPATGVFMRKATFYFHKPVNHDSVQLTKMNELRRHVRGFQHDAGLVHAPGLNADPGICDAYAHVAPMIDTDRYMAWLMNQVHQAGCQVTQGRVDGRLSDKAAALRRLFKADCIVNCTGLGARDLGDETMYPLRGAILRVCNDGRQFPRVVEAHCVAQAEPGDDQSFIFIVPRGEETLILGGFSEPRAWDLSIGLHNCQRVRQVWQRCTRFLPALANARLDPVEPVRAGLRPYRPCNVRLDAEPETNIIHNYGHGGAGVTFSWGCAREACQLVEQRLGLAVTPAS